MGAITPRWFMDFESRMSLVTENEYSRLLQNMWWTLVGRTRTTQAGRDVIAWLLSTAQIHDEGEGGNIRFDDLVSQTTEMSPKFSGAGLELTRAQLTDTDGNGLDLSAAWSAQIGAQMAYWPQEQTAYFMMNGHIATEFTGYDGKAFFATDHPINPYKTQAGTYANLFTGAASGSYPGALPIHGNDHTVALQNLEKAYGYIASIKMPNGKQPRRLRPKGLIVPPLLMPRATLLTQSKMLVTPGAGGVGMLDQTAIISTLGYASPVQADELGGFEDNTSYFIVAEQITDNQLGAMVYLERDPYQINYYGPQTQAQLNRTDRWEWHVKGRNAVQPGHPYLLFKVKAT